MNVHEIYTCLPLTQEIRHEPFGSPDLSVFLIDLSSDGKYVYSSENSIEFLRTPGKT